MTLGDFKLYSINTLLVTIGYTVSKWFKLKKGK
jgi:hypothetical protein